MDTLVIDRKLGNFRWTAPTLAINLLPDLGKLKSITGLTDPTGTLNNQSVCKIVNGKTSGTLKFLVQGKDYQYEAVAYGWNLVGAVAVVLLPNPGGGTTPPPRTLTSIALSGPSSVNEGASGTYSVVGTYSDGTMGAVTSGITWSSNAPNGVLSIPADSVSGNSRSVTMAATVGSLVGYYTVQAVDTTAPPADGSGFTLAQPQYVRVGVYTQDGTRLVRSLNVSRQLTPAGTIMPQWDGVGDDGSLHNVSDGYVFLPFAHGQSDLTSDTFQNPLGNTSTTGGTGPTAWSGYNHPVKMAFAAGRGFAVTGFAEHTRNIYYWTTDPNSVSVLLEQSDHSGTHMCTDGTLMYVGVIFIQGSYNGGVSGPGIVAFDPQTLQYYTFDQGQLLQYQQHSYSVLGIGDSTIRGLTVQKTGNFLFSCHETDNSVVVRHKKTGAVLQRLFMDQPRWCTLLDDNTLCVAYGENTTDLFTVNSDATLTLKGIRIAGLTQAGDMAYKASANELHILDVAENARIFTGNDSANSGSELLIPNKIYSYHRRTLRYVGPAGARLAESAWDSINPATNANWVALSSPMPSTATHRRRVYNATTGQHIRDQGVGDYGVNPLGVTPDKFCFGDCENFRDAGNNCFIAFEPDGSSWVGDGMKRSSKFDTNEQYVTQIAFTGSTYNLAGHAKKPWQGWDNFLLYKRNYNLPLGPTNGSWEMYGNYSCFAQPVQDINNQDIKTQRNLTTAKDGHDYSLLREGYKWRIWELTDTAFFPTNAYTQDLGSCLDHDANIWDVNGYDVGGKQEYPQRVLTGRDSGGTPQFAAPVVEYWVSSVGINDPFCTGLMAGPADDGTLIVYDVGASNTDAGRQGKDSFHVAGVRKGTGVFAWRAGHATHRTYAGEQPYGSFFDTGNNVGYAGSFYVVIGNLVIVGFRGEFWKNGQCNNYRVYNSKGIFMFQFGEDRDGAFTYGLAEAGQGGSGLTGWASVSNGALYFYHGTEGSGPAGPNEWAFRNFLGTYTEFAPIPVTTLTPAFVDPTNPLVGLPYDSAITSGQNGIVLRGNTTAYTGIETLDKTAPDITFFISANGATGDLGSADVPVLRSGDATGNWRYSSELAWKNLFADDDYHDATDELLDDTGKIIYRLTYVQLRVSDTETDFNLLANSNVRPPNSGSPVVRNGVVLSSMPGIKQVFNTLYLRNYVVQRQGNKLLVSTNNSAAVLVDVFDPTANINRPTMRRFKYNSYSGGNWKVAIHAPQFLPATPIPS